jgi:hypothetical protein
MEWFAWLVCFIAWAVWRCRDEEEEEMASSGQWYLIYRYRWQGVDMIREREPIDGVYASYADAAVQVALTRNDYRTDERLNAVFCATAPQRVKASDLDGRHTCDWWCRTDFIDWMCQPAFSGDQDKYLRTWTI